MAQITPSSTPRVTVSVPMPQPMPQHQQAPQGPPQAPPAAPPPPAPAQPPATVGAPSPPWLRPPEPEFRERPFVEAHSLILPFSMPPKKTYRPEVPFQFRRVRYGRQEHAGFVTNIAHSVNDHLRSQVYADYLAEQGMPAAEEVVRTAVARRQHPAQDMYRNSVDAHGEGAIIPEVVQIADASPHGTAFWSYPVSRFGRQDGYGIALMVLGHGPAGHRTIVQFHSGPHQLEEAQRLYDGLKAEGHAESVSADRQHDRPGVYPRHQHRMSRVRFQRDEETAFHRGILENPKDNVRHLAYADWLDEHGRPFTAEFIRRAVEQFGDRGLHETGEPGPGVYWGSTPPGGIVHYLPESHYSRRGDLIMRPLSHPNGRLFYTADFDNDQDKRRMREGLAAEGGRDIWGQFNPDPRRRMARIPGRWASRMHSHWNYYTLNRFLGDRLQRRLDRSRQVVFNPIDQTIALYLHNTPVVTWHREGGVTLRHGGWQTPTTRDTINSVLGSGTVHGRGGRLTLSNSGNPVYDGMRLDSYGNEIHGNRMDRDTFNAWRESLREDPTRAPILADYLEERDLHANATTLHVLRDTYFPRHSLHLTDDGKVDAAGIHPAAGLQPEQMARKLTARQKSKRKVGRLIAREWASGKHEDRRSAVLAALALSSNLGKTGSAGQGGTGSGWAPQD